MDRPNNNYRYREGTLKNISRSSRTDQGATLQEKRDGAQEPSVNSGQPSEALRTKETRLNTNLSGHSRFPAKEGLDYSIGTFAIRITGPWGMKHKHFLMAGTISLYLALPAQGHASTASKTVQIEGLGRVPRAIVLACEQAVGDGGHESFYDAEWDLFSDCINDNLRSK
jgi:hypothetical protein